MNGLKCQVLVEDVAVEVYGVESKEKEQSGYIISEEGNDSKLSCSATISVRRSRCPALC